MLYPNPTDGAVTLKAEGIFGKATFKLLDSMGKELSQQTVQGNELGQGVGVDLSQLSSGLYFLKIQTEEGNHFMKVVKH
ncbi:MAG: T9SS type A sorting domain-containing protein [Chitinophagales bacterium]|nr:T9SS type A sorting domain-containing protein [Chitinophagales bacterium]